LFFVFWIGAQIFILEDRLVPLAATLALGVVNKEALLIVAPLYAIAEPGPRARRLARAAMAAAPAAAIYAAIHLHAVRAGTSEDASKSLMEAIASFPRGERLRSLISGALLAGGPLWISALWGARAAEPRLLRWAVAGALCTTPLVIIAADAGRMLGLLIPFWMPLALTAWRRCHAARPAWQLIAPVLIGEALLATTVQIDAHAAIENLLRLAGVALSLSPLLLSRSAAPKPSEHLASG